MLIFIIRHEDNSVFHFILSDSRSKVSTLNLNFAIFLTWLCKAIILKKNL